MKKTKIFELMVVGGVAGLAYATWLKAYKSRVYVSDAADASFKKKHQIIAAVSGSLAALGGIGFLSTMK